MGWILVGEGFRSPAGWRGLFMPRRNIEPESRLMPLEVARGTVTSPRQGPLPGHGFPGELPGDRDPGAAEPEQSPGGNDHDGAPRLQSEELEIAGVQRH